MLRWAIAALCAMAPLIAGCMDAGAPALSDPAPLSLSGSTQPPLVLEGAPWAPACPPDTAPNAIGTCVGRIRAGPGETINVVGAAFDPTHPGRIVLVTRERDSGAPADLLGALGAFSPDRMVVRLRDPTSGEWEAIEVRGDPVTRQAVAYEHWGPLAFLVEPNGRLDALVAHCQSASPAGALSCGERKFVWASSDDGGRTWPPATVILEDFPIWSALLASDGGPVAVWGDGEGVWATGPSLNGSHWPVVDFPSLFPDCAETGRLFSYGGGVGNLCRLPTRPGTEEWALFVLDTTNLGVRQMDLGPMATERPDCPTEPWPTALREGGLMLASPCDGWLMFGWPQRGLWVGPVSMLEEMEKTPRQYGLGIEWVVADADGRVHVLAVAHGDVDEAARILPLRPQWTQTRVHLLVDPVAGAIVRQAALAETNGWVDEYLRWDPLSEGVARGKAAAMDPFPFFAYPMDGAVEYVALERAGDGTDAAYA